MHPQHAAAGSLDGSVYVWNVASGALVSTLKGPPHAVTALAWSPAGAPVAAAYKNGALLLWE